MRACSHEIVGDADYFRMSIGAGAKPGLDQIAAWEERFHQDGWVMLPGMLDDDEAARLRSVVEERHHAVSPGPRDDEADLIRGVALMRMFETSGAFLQLMAREPALTLVERILGEDCHVLSQTALRTPPFNGITRWHVDGPLWSPGLPRNIDWRPPCYSLSVMVALSGLEDVAFGPTRVIVGSHLSGAVPDPDLPGAPHTTILAKPGDAFLLNHQTWHCAHQNVSQRVRHMAVTAYGRRGVQQRFYPFLNYRCPDHVLAACEAVTLRLLGRHEKGPLG
ncbi:MAG: phytanoyl-CoA dioxygenase family protein [Oceanicaulis sp.]